MKLRILANATLLGSMLLPLAQAQITVGLKGNIPFEFRVKDTTLPAGEYTVTRLSGGTQVLIMKNSNRKVRSVNFLSNGVRAKSIQSSKLVFHRYGRTYFLSQVWQGLGQNDGLQLVQSKEERTIAHQMAASPQHQKVELASVSLRSLVQGTGE
jgi:hypothetical protein